MKAFLLAIALCYVTVWTNPKTDEATYIQWCRNTGNCVENLTWVTENVEEVALRHGLDPLWVMAMVMTESQLNVRAKSKIGAFGLLQLHPRSKAGREAKRLCRKKTRRECDLISLEIAARELKVWTDGCPTLTHTAYSWRTGHCGLKPKERFTVAWSYSKKTVALYHELQRKYERHLQQ